MFNLKIDKFRSYKEQAFDFRRVNILIGENSGGKSSLIKALLSLKQTLESPETSNLILNGKHTDLGNYKEVIQNHTEDDSMTFTFSFPDDLKGITHFWFEEMLEDLETEKQNSVNNIIRSSLKYETTVSYQISKTLDDHNSLMTEFNNEFLGSLTITYENTIEEEESAEKEEYDIEDRKGRCILTYYSKVRNKDIVLKNIPYDKKGFMSLVASEPLQKKCDKIGENELFYELAFFLLNQNLVDIKLRRISYLNPLSSNPKRIYVNKDAQNEYSKADLEKFTNQITTKKIPAQTVNKFNKILGEFGIANRVKVLSPKELPVSEVRVQIKDIESNITDVGYGVSLQIPLLFEAFLAEQSRGATFIIEQPEVHLHPKLQAKFIDTLLKLGRKNKYIIETHSEHLVRMLQVIVKEKAHKISADKVRIFYFQRGVSEFSVSRHPLDENGKMIKPFPPGFFDTTYDLAKKLLF